MLFPHPEMLFPAHSCIKYVLPYTLSHVPGPVHSVRDQPNTWPKSLGSFNLRGGIGVGGLDIYTHNHPSNT